MLTSKTCWIVWFYFLSEAKSSYSYGNLMPLRILDFKRRFNPVDYVLHAWMMNDYTQIAWCVMPSHWWPGKIFILWWLMMRHVTWQHTHHGSHLARARDMMESSAPDSRHALGMCMAASWIPFTSRVIWACDGRLSKLQQFIWDRSWVDMGWDDASISTWELCILSSSL